MRLLYEVFMHNLRAQPWPNARLRGISRIWGIAVANTYGDLRTFFRMSAICAERHRLKRRNGAHLRDTEEAAPFLLRIQR